MRLGRPFRPVARTRRLFDTARRGPTEESREGQKREDQRGRGRTLGPTHGLAYESMQTGVVD